MQSKTLIVSTNLTPAVMDYDTCKTINFLLLEVMRDRVYQITEAYNFDESMITIGFLPLVSPVELYEDYTADLSKYNLLPVVIPVEKFIESSMLDKRLSGTYHSTNETVKVCINYNLMFLSNGTLLLTEEIF